MKGRETFCEKVSELKSLKGLGLSEKYTGLLKLRGEDLRDLVYDVRRADMLFGYFDLKRSMFFDETMLGELEEAERRACAEEIYETVKIAGLLNGNLRNLGEHRIVKNYLKDMAAILWFEGSLAYDERYCFAGGVEKNKDKILATLEGGLTASQFEMAKLDVNSDILEDYTTDRYEAEKNSRYLISPEESKNLRSARLNSKNFLSERLVEVIFS